MKILITSCGIGIGHVSRDLALAKILEKNNHEVEFASYGAGLHYLKKNNYTPYSLPPMNFTCTNGEIKIENTIKDSKDIPFTFIKSMYKESRIIKKSKPDLIITDSQYSTPITAKLLNIPCYIITNDLTFGFSKGSDFKSIKYFEKSIRKFIIEISKGCQKILIPDIPGSIQIPEELVDKSRYIGPILHQNHDELESNIELRKKHDMNLSDKIILLTVGGSDFGQILIDKICKISDNINCDKIIIFTGFEIDPDDINLYGNDYKIIIRQYTPNMIEWMKLSDLTISLAGHTTSMELISVKKPNIMIPLKNHIEQERNLLNIQQYDITQTSALDDEEGLINIINHTLDNLDNISINDEKYNTFIQYDGKVNAMKIIENLK